MCECFLASHLVHAHVLVSPAHTPNRKVAPTTPTPQTSDGPNDEGENFDRPGRLSDKLPAPYANEEAARYANGGAYPPDLSLITKARHAGANYIFALLLGYREPPAGISVGGGGLWGPLGRRGGGQWWGACAHSFHGKQNEGGLAGGRGLYSAPCAGGAPSHPLPPRRKMHTCIPCLPTGP